MSSETNDHSHGHDLTLDMTRNTEGESPSRGVKVGYVVKRYPRFSETFIVNEILAHEAAGLPVEIFALRPVEETHFQDTLGQVRAPVTRLPDKLRSADSLWELMVQTLRALPKAWEILASFKGENARNVAQSMMLAMECQKRGVTHLHAHFGTVSTSVARLAARLAGITYSFTAHAKDIYYHYDVPQQLQSKIDDASHVVTVSEFNVDFLRQRYQCHSDRIVRIYNGLDLTRFAYQDPEPTATRLLAVGRLVEKKGFHILVEAIRILVHAGRQVNCEIVGTGDEMRNLQAQIDSGKLGDSVRLLGARPQSEVFVAMRSSALLACPCIVGDDGNRDGLPTVLIEAMALGVPCISTDVTGIPELVLDNETGLCVPQGDAEALASAMLRILDDKALRQRLARAGRRRVERNFDQKRNSAVLRSVFDTAIGAHARVEQGAA
ncbi:glycosyltransferase family 4 protein [Granulosicoccus sp. 3-233]